MKSLSLDPVQPDPTGEHEEALYSLLKTAGEPETDEDESTVGTTHVYDEPDDRGEAGTVDAPWGEQGTTQDGHPQADHQSDGAWAEHKDVRSGVTKRVLDSRPKADAVEQQLMAKNFKHVAKGDFTTHSVHLQPKSVEKVSHPRSVSLMEQIRRTTGRI